MPYEFSKNEKDEIVMSVFADPYKRQNKYDYKISVVQCAETGKFFTKKYERIDASDLPQQFTQEEKKILEKHFVFEHQYRHDSMKECLIHLINIACAITGKRDFEVLSLESLKSQIKEKADEVSS